MCVTTFHINRQANSERAILLSKTEKVIDWFIFMIYLLFYTRSNNNFKSKIQIIKRVL